MLQVHTARFAVSALRPVCLQAQKRRLEVDKRKCRQADPRSKEQGLFRQPSLCPFFPVYVLRSKEIRMHHLSYCSFLSVTYPHNIKKIVYMCVV
jgi:hypothetical protein